MSPRLELPAVPPVMVLGDQVAYRGQAAADLLQLLDLALEALGDQAQRVGQHVPDRYLLLRFAAQQATADMRTSSDVRKSRTSAGSESGPWVGVREAARLLAVGERQARRRVEQAGGTKTPKGWRVRRADLLADQQLRECG